MPVHERERHRLPTGLFNIRNDRYTELDKNKQRVIRHKIYKYEKRKHPRRREIVAVIVIVLVGLLMLVIARMLIILHRMELV